MKLIRDIGAIVAIVILSLSIIAGGIFVMLKVLV